MFCHKCGNKLAEGAGFCSKCGAKQQSDVAATDPVTTDTPKSTPKAVTTPFVVGSNVLAKWTDDLYYFGSITEIRDDQAHIRFFDNNTIWVKLTELVEPTRINASMTIEAIWDDVFYRCEILSTTANTAKVRFVDDGIESEVNFTDIRASTQRYLYDNASDNDATVNATSVIRTLWGAWIGTKWGGAITIFAVLVILGAFLVPNITRGPVAGGHGEYISFTVAELRQLMQNENNIYMRYVHGRPIALTGEIAETSTRVLSLRIPSSSWASVVDTNNNVRRSINDNYFSGDIITLYGISNSAAFNVPGINRATNIRPPNATIVTLAEVRRR